MQMSMERKDRGEPPAWMLRLAGKSPLGTGFQCLVAVAMCPPALWLCHARQTTGKVLAMTCPCAPHRYDDYDYAEVNQLLERMLKVYIKTVTCYPEKTNSEMFDRFWKQFKHSEKVG